jgi:SAM-dependent methyltransferase
MLVYEQTLVGPLFEPWATVLLDELALQEGERLLDVATGPGTLARLAAARAGRHGQVTACDLSPGMLAVAKEKPFLPEAAPIEYIECPAASLRVPDDTFDVAACQQGLQFFPDRRAALIEMRRVLKGGGRVGVAVWSAIDRCPPFALLAEAIGQVMGEQIADRYRAGPWGLADGDSLGGLLADAGFEQVHVNEFRLPVTFEGGPAQLLASLPATGIASDIEGLDLSQREALTTKVADLLSPLTVAGQLVSEMASNIATAVRPSDR